MKLYHINSENENVKWFVETAIVDVQSYIDADKENVRQGGEALAKEVKRALNLALMALKRIVERQSTELVLAKAEVIAILGLKSVIVSLEQVAANIAVAETATVENSASASASASTSTEAFTTQAQTPAAPAPTEAETSIQVVATAAPTGPIAVDSAPLAPAGATAPGTLASASATSSEKAPIPYWWERPLYAAVCEGGRKEIKTKDLKPAAPTPELRKTSIKCPN